MGTGKGRVNVQQGGSDLPFVRNFGAGGKWAVHHERTITHYSAALVPAALACPVREP